MKKYIIWLNVVMILFLLLSACAQPTQEATQEVEKEAEATEAPEAPEAMPEDITIGAVLFGRDSFFENIQTGMELAAEELGVELLVSIHDHDIAKETEFIEDYIARGVDAIVITPESLDASVAAIKQAYDAGITVVCFNTCINETDAEKYVTAFYETDQASLGYQTGEYLADWLDTTMSGEEVNVGILQCDRFEACKRRGDGFRDALADKGVEWNEVGNQEGFMPDEGSTVAEGMLQANPEINILWSENEGGTVGEVIAVRTMGLGDAVYVFGTDISPQLAEMLLADDNILQAVTGQSPRLMGGSSVAAAVSSLKGEAVEYYQVVPNAFYSRDDTAAVNKYLEEYGAPPKEVPTATGDYTIGAVLFGRDSFFENIQRGMETGADEAGAELLVSIHDHDIAKETEFIEDYIARGVNAIVITPESLDASVAAIKQAYDAGITVVCFNTCINETDAEKYVTAFYETDQASLGYQTGEYLAEWLGTTMSGEEVNVGILQCDRFEACKRRGDGFREALADKGVEWNEVGNQEGFMPDEGSTVAESMLQANPEINILWSENEGGTVGEVIAVRTMGLSDAVFVFGTDISPQLAEMLLADDNILQAVTGQSPRLMGSSSVLAAVSLLNGDDVDFYHVVPNAFYSREDTDAVQLYLAEY